MKPRNRRNEAMFVKWKQGWSYRKLSRFYKIDIRACWEIVKSKKEKPKCIECNSPLRSYKSLYCFSCTRLGSRNPKWIGDKVGYNALHAWVSRRLGKPNTCEKCGKKKLKGCKIHWANKSKKYLRELSDWIRLCRSCHKQQHARARLGR
jgi:hypothetical protein